MRVESIKRPPCGACTVGSVMFGSCERCGDDLAVGMVGHRRHGLCSSFYEPVNIGLTTNGGKKAHSRRSKEGSGGLVWMYVRPSGPRLSLVAPLTLRYR